MPISSCLFASTFVRRFHRAVHLKASPDTIAIRREDASIWERRAPLAPGHVERLSKQGVRVLIQPSNRRAYPLQSYIQAGAEPKEDISEAQVILGVKQVPIDLLLAGKTYCFFSHTIKAQEANMPLLDAVLDKSIRLIDYERLVDDNDQRVVAFGKYAGYAGMINILHGMGLRLLALGHHTPFMHLGPAHNYRTAGTAMRAVRDAGYEVALGRMPRSIGPLTFVFTGSGNVSQGAQEIFNELPIEYVEPADLKEAAERGSTCKIYGTVVTRAHHLRRKDSAPPLENQNGVVAEFDADEYTNHPERYYSTFSSDIAPYASVIVNGVYWPPNAPRLLTIPDAKLLQQPTKLSNFHDALYSTGAPALPHRLIAICDISADPGGSIEFMQDCTTIDNPFCLYDAEQNTSNNSSFAGDGILICSIDNMPTQLPLESTDMFGNLLFPYLTDIINTTKTRNDDSEQLSGVVRSAIIASDGRLRPNYEYINQLRAKQESSNYKRSSDTKEVLVLGAGHVSGPLIEYLCRDPKVHVTVVSSLEKEINANKQYASKHGNIRGLVMDISQKQDHLTELIRDSDLVVSLLPYSFHPQIAKLCINQKTNMLTASYLSEEMRELHEAAKEANITVVNEIGLDPGIDHLLAKQVIDQIASGGGRVTSFTSFCCGLPTPEFADNPLGYKFGWNPTGAFAITMNGARWKESNQVFSAEPGTLMDYSKNVDSFLKGFSLEVFPNRDSLKYQDLYELSDAKTLIRGSLRYQGFSETVRTLRAIGLMDQSQKAYLQPETGSDLSWRQLLAEMFGFSHDISASNLKNLVYEKIGKSESGLKAIVSLGLFGDEPVLKCGSPFNTIRHHLIKRYQFCENENDLVIMRITFGIEWAHKKSEQRAVSLVVYGAQDGFSAMARTVGYPAAIACKMMLEGEIQNNGMVVPLQPEIYHPILSRLKQEGIFAREEIC